MKEHKDGKIENSQTEPIAKQGPEQVSAKKPYENPQIIYRAPLETMAGVCGTTPGKTMTEGSCSILQS